MPAQKKQTGLIKVNGYWRTLADGRQIWIEGYTRSPSGKKSPAGRKASPKGRGRSPPKKCPPGCVSVYECEGKPAGRGKSASRAKAPSPRRGSPKKSPKKGSPKKGSPKRGSPKKGSPKKGGYTVKVAGYMRKDGIWVEPYTRTVSPRGGASGRRSPPPRPPRQFEHYGQFSPQQYY